MPNCEYTSAWFLMLGSGSFRRYIWNGKTYLYAENKLDVAGAVTAVVMSEMCELCNNRKLQFELMLFYLFFRSNIMKILKRQREGALPLSWMTPWQSVWGRTPRWSVMPLTKVSTLTSWRWTGDLASLLVSWRSFSAGHNDCACPSFRSSLLVHWTAPPMCDVLPNCKWTNVLLMHHIEWDSWLSPGIVSILSVIGHSLSLITFWS